MLYQQEIYLSALQPKAKYLTTTSSSTELPPISFTVQFYISNLLVRVTSRKHLLYAFQIWVRFDTSAFITVNGARIVELI